MTDEAADRRPDDAADTDGYVHTPSNAHVDVDTPDAHADDRQGAPPTVDREFDWRGWTLVGFLVVALILVPAALYFLPRVQGVATSLGLSLRDAYLVLPLLPAILLGLLAVWATTRP